MDARPGLPTPSGPIKSSVGESERIDRMETYLFRYWVTNWVKNSLKKAKIRRNARPYDSSLSSTVSKGLKAYRNGQESQSGDLKSLASKEQIKYAGGTNSEQDWDILRRAAFFGGLTRTRRARAADHSQGLGRPPLDPQ